MNADLKNKTIHSFKWSMLDKGISFLFSFVIGLLIARILNPSDFGLIGLTTIFIALSQIIIDGGFSLAIIQKNEVSEIDYSTVFLVNFSIGIVLYLLLFMASPLIADYYQKDVLETILQVVGINIVINSLGIIPSAKLTKELNIKIQSKISLFSLLISSVTALIMVFNNFGVWTLVWQTIVKNFTNVALLWYFTKWKPKLIFNLASIKSMFHFSKNILSLGIIGVIYDNIFLLAIGKIYSIREVGIYSKSNQLQQLPLSIYTGSLTKILLSVLSRVQSENEKLKKAYANFIVFSAIIIFPIMFGISALAQPIVLVLFGSKWIEMVPYLKIMAMYGCFYPLIAINLNLLLVKNRSDLYIKLDLVKFAMAFFLIFLIQKSVLHLLMGFAILFFLSFLLHAYFTQLLIKYNFVNQMLDILPVFLSSALMYIAIQLITVGVTGMLPKLILGMLTGVIAYVCFSLLFNRRKFVEIIDLIKQNIPAGIPFINQFKLQKNSVGN